MANNHDRQAHADALTRQRNANSSARFMRKFRMMLCATALGSIALPAATIEPEHLSRAWDYAIGSFKWNILLMSPFKPDKMPTMTATEYGQSVDVTIDRIALNPWYRYNAHTVLDRVEDGAMAGLGLGLGGLALAAWLKRRRREEVLRDRVVAGTMVVSEKQLAKRTTTLTDERALSVGRVPLPNQLETRHMAMIGTTGSGKTTALRQLLDGIEARGDAALVYDTSGEFIAHYYNPERGDVILNPFDTRGAFWSPFAEMRHPADANSVAATLVSSTGNREDDVWLDAARGLVGNIMRTLWEAGSPKLEDLLEAIQSKTSDELKIMVAHTSSARLFAEDAERATGSVLFMLARVSNLLQFLRADGTGGKPFAFRDHIEALDGHHGARPWIFVPRKEEHFEAMKPLLACWLECAASSILSLWPSHERRIWLMLDELADLPRVPGLTRLLPEGRKYGAAIVLTFQSIGQMRARYSTQGAEAMLGNCNTKLFLQTTDVETRQWASNTIGTCEVEIQTLSNVLAQGDDKARTTLSTTRQMRAAVLESDLRLEPHKGYLLLPDGLPVAKVRLTDAHITARGAARQRAFVAADVKTTLWGRGGLTAPPAPAASTSSGSGPV